MAIDRLDREKCGKCGHPSWIAHNSDNNLQFEIEEIECFACQALEEHEKKRKDGEKKPGITEFAVPKMETWEFEPEGEKTPLPDRESYLRQEADRARRLAEIAANKVKAE